MTEDRTARLARAWDEAADHYERYLVPRFEPWVATAVGGLPDVLPPGPVLVPCCGTFPELPPLAAAHPEREVVGVDLSPVMVERARQRAAAHPLARARHGDATDLGSSWPGTTAAVVSIFGLQQLPDPVEAITDWVGTLRRGGWLSVVYWPPVIETTGPFALLDAVIDEALGSEPEPDWPDRLGPAVAATGAHLVHDKQISHLMSHPDAATLWSAMTEGGPLRPLVLARGQDFIAALRLRFLAQASAGPWHHHPTARWILAVRAGTVH